MCGQLRVEKKYISKELAMKELKLGPKEFEKLIVISDVHPYLPVRNQRIDDKDDFYFRISDIKILIESAVYRAILKQQKVVEDRKRLIKSNRQRKLGSIPTPAIDYVSVIKEKYSSFADCLKDIGNSLNGLYLYKSIGFDPINKEDAEINENQSGPVQPDHKQEGDEIKEALSENEDSNFKKAENNNNQNQKYDLNSTDEDIHRQFTLEFSDQLGITTILEEFENFIANNSFIKYAFLSRVGVYYQIKFEKLSVVYFSAYPGATLADLAEAKIDIPLAATIKANINEYLSSDEEDMFSSDSDDMEPMYNDPSKLDLSILYHSAPLYSIHIQLALSKLKTIYQAEGRSKNRLFAGKKMYVSSRTIENHIKSVVLNCSGTIVNNVEDADISVSEKVDAFVEGKIYVQPQYVFDCLNQNKLLNPDLYLVGKVLPEHKCPFLSVEQFVRKENLMTMSNIAKRRLYDIINQHEDIHYQGDNEQNS